MSLCRGRLFSDGEEGRSFEEIPAYLADSETEVDHHGVSELSTSLHDISMDTGGSPMRSISNGLDDSSHFWPDFTSPTPVSSPQPKRPFSRRNHLNMSPIPTMTFEDDTPQHDDSGLSNTSTPPDPTTPPHCRLKALRLFDTPHTPKSLLQKAQRRTSRTDSSHKTKLLFTNNNNASVSKFRKYVEERPQANVNPFTPNNNAAHSGVKRKVNRSVLDDSLEDDFDEEMPSSKKLALREINTSRYNEEFYEICKLGVGEFGSVHKCINRLDGVTYAIKKSKTPVAGSVYERNAMNEVYAHAVLGKHPHVVRYYSAWAEKDHMYIQNEYCNGGSLADLISENEKLGHLFSEEELKTILRQLAQGLKYIHSQQLVHLDIKPGNIFFQRNPKILNSPESGMEEDLEEDVGTEPIVYKIGDLGHVTSLTNPSIEEGDCRYLPNEILQEDTDHLTRADVFSLALTIYAAGRVGDLPKNGEEWHAIRRGELPHLCAYSNEFNDLLKSMVRADPRARPSASLLCQHAILCPYGVKTKAQLRRELNEQKFKNELLSRQLLEATARATASKPEDTPTALPETISRSGRGSRLVGRKVNRSMSLSAF